MEIVTRKRKKSTVGRKEYKPSSNDYSQAYTYFKRNYTDSQIAEKINISPVTYARHKDKFLNYYAKKEEIKSANLDLKERDKAVYAPKYKEYKDFPVDLIRKLVVARFSQKDISACLHMSFDTFKRYLKKFPELKRLIETSSMLADANIVSKLYDRANGMIVDGKHFASYMGEITEHTYKKMILPDLTAIQTVLYNSKNVDFAREGSTSNISSKGQILEALEFLSDENAVSFTEDEEKENNYNEHFTSEDIENGEYEEV